MRNPKAGRAVEQSIGTAVSRSLLEPNHEQKVTTVPEISVHVTKSSGFFTLKVSLINIFRTLA